ncbi:MAG: tetratricopeptide repeat protein, partial [Chloroflexi bacterium]|nr:tetratricopeptide repeat protein [Chloroflexota bacterium]
TRRLLELEACHEEAHRQLMSLLALTGQRELALRQYERCRDALAATYDTAPQAETTALYRRIRQAPNPAAGGSDFHLPVPTTPLLGRRPDLDALRARLADPDCRLLTIQGRGGCGKTHLALALAEGLRAEDGAAYPDGIVFVPLGALRRIEALPSAIAHQLGFQFYKDAAPIRQLYEYLADRRMLLILDNFEHLITPAGPDTEPEEMNTGVLTQMIRHAAGVKVMVTSRVRLNLKGEYVYPLDGIEFPSLQVELTPAIASTPAVELFIQSARRIAPGFVSDENALAEIVKICRQVQGLPLGILLAAGWSGLLSPGEIASRLLAEDSIDLLESAAGDFPARHRSLRAVLAYSWKLLSAGEQATLAALSIFRSDFNLEAARQVAGAGLGDLRSLMDHSLLQRSSDGRYGIHEFPRQFAREKLEHLPIVRSRFWDYYAARLTAWAADIQSDRQIEAIETLDLEIDNVRAAWDWAVADGNLDFLDQAIDGICLYYDWRHRFPEGLSDCAALIETLQHAETRGETGNRLQSKRLMAQALAWQGVFSPLENAERLLRQALLILDRLEGPAAGEKAILAERAFTCYQLARVISQTGDQHAEAWNFYDQSRAIYAQLGDDWGCAEALRGLGVLLEDQSKYTRARELLEKSLAIQEQIGDRRGTAATLSWLGMNALFQGDEGGERLIRESIAIYTELGERIRVLEGVILAGISLMVLGRFEETRALMEEIDTTDARIVYRQDSRQSILSCALAHLGRYAEARDRAETGLALARRLGDAYGLGFALVARGWPALVEGEDARAFDLFRESAEVCDRHGIKEVFTWALSSQGFTAYRLGRPEDARRACVRALQVAVESESFVGMVFSAVFSLPLVAGLGAAELAVELQAALYQIPMVANSAFFGDLVLQPMEAFAAGQPRATAVQAQGPGQRPGLDEVMASLLDLLSAEKTIH